MSFSGRSILKGFIIYVGAMVLAVTLLIMVHEATMIANWSQSGFVLSSLRISGKPTTDSTVVTFFEADPLDFIGTYRPAAGDTLLTLDDSVATTDRWIRLLELPHEPGREVKLTFRHGGVERESLFKTRPVATELRLSIMVLQALKILIFLSFMIVGFWAFIRRSGSPGVRALALYCFAMASFMALTPMPMYRDMGSFRVPLEQGLRIGLSIFGIFFASFWLLLHLLFPHVSRFMRKRPFLAYAAALGPQAIGIVIQTWLRTTQGPHPSSWTNVAIITAVFIQVITGSVFLWLHYRRAQSHLEKRQTKLVLYGSTPGLLLFLYYLLKPFQLQFGLFQSPLIERLVLTNVVFLVLLLSPITFAYAFGRYRLLEVEGRLRRGTRYLLVTGLLLAVFFGVVYLVGELLLHNLNITSRAPTLFVALVLALGFTPAHRSIQLQLERYFYPERQRLRNMVRGFLKIAFAQPDREALRAELEQRLRDSLGVESVHLWLNKPLAKADAIPSSNGLFATDGEFMHFLRRKGHPLLVDELLASERVDFLPAEESWLAQRQIALVLPLTTREGLQGFLALGHKPNQDDYEAEELQILTGLADQVALAVENLKLLEENLEKRRMEEELQVARRVQERFLPKELPPVQGLDLAAHSTFCLEIAGDYYDVVPLPDGRTALAVGDVSGKGAGAALIMANLQAGLRALCSVDLSLPVLMARLNTLIYQNTEPDQFITLVVAVFDPHQRALDYVNAGHNAPFLIRAAGRVETLETGGLLLGAFPQVAYQQGRVELRTGDLLLMYTDGLSEAMDAGGVELGEQPLCEAAIAVETPGAAIALSRVMETVLTHQGQSTHVDDDQTLLIARVL